MARLLSVLMSLLQMTNADFTDASQFKPDRGCASMHPWELTGAQYTYTKEESKGAMADLGHWQIDVDVRTRLLRFGTVRRGTGQPLPSARGERPDWQILEDDASLLAADLQ